MCRLPGRNWCLELPLLWPTSTTELVSAVCQHSCVPPIPSFCSWGLGWALKVQLLFNKNYSLQLSNIDVLFSPSFTLVLKGKHSWAEGCCSVGRNERTFQKHAGTHQHTCQWKIKMGRMLYPEQGLVKQAEMCGAMRQKLLQRGKRMSLVETEKAKM